MLGDDGVSPVDLTLDRTNWRYGESDINALVIGLVHAGVSVPVACEMLDKKGNSNSAERVKLLDELLARLPAKRIRTLFGDREFIGEAWFSALQERNIPYIMRVRENLIATLPDGGTQLLSALFAGLGRENKSPIMENVLFCGVRQHLQAMRLKTGELLILAFHGVTQKRPLAAYRRRWSIETLFSCMKKRGFDIEATHMTCLAKLKKLFAIVAIAVTWSLRIGETCERKRPAKIKNHGYKASSTFQTGKRQIAKAARKPENTLMNLCKIFRKITEIPLIGEICVG
jgi:hypothetical protein